MLALLASLRVGALAALVLGPAAALGLSGRVPGLITGTRDAFVVALYLGGFFGVSMAAASLIVSLLVYWVAGRSMDRFATRGRRAARAAGALVTVLCVVYLTLWWQTVIAGLGWSSPLWTLSALTLAVAMSLLLGHAVTVATSAVVLSATGGTADVAGAGPAKSSARATIASAAIVFGVAALLFTWTSARSAGRPGSARPSPSCHPDSACASSLSTASTAGVFESLAASGRVPALRAALGGATRALHSRPGDAGDPARVWTTVATGQPPEVHAVQGLETRRLAGVQGSVAVAEPSPLGRAIRGATDLVRLTRPAIASGSERRAKTFWEVAAEAGLRTVVVNWWATWPAPARRGRRVERQGRPAARAWRRPRCRDCARRALRIAAREMERYHVARQGTGLGTIASTTEGLDSRGTASLRRARRDPNRPVAGRRDAENRSGSGLPARARHRATRAPRPAEPRTTPQPGAIDALDAARGSQ